MQCENAEENQNQHSFMNGESSIDSNMCNVHLKSNQSDCSLFFGRMNKSPKIKSIPPSHKQSIGYSKKRKENAYT